MSLDFVCSSLSCLRRVISEERRPKISMLRILICDINSSTRTLRDELSFAMCLLTSKYFFLKISNSSNEVVPMLARPPVLFRDSRRDIFGIYAGRASEVLRRVCAINGAAVDALRWLGTPLIRWTRSGGYVAVRPSELRSRRKWLANQLGEGMCDNKVIYLLILFTTIHASTF